MHVGRGGIGAFDETRAIFYCVKNTGEGNEGLTIQEGIVASKPEAVKERLQARLALLLPDSPRVAQEGDPSGSCVFMDQALIARAEELEEVLGNGQRQTVQRIITAFHKLQTGGYGTCENCHERIGDERLEAQPEAALCIGCQTKIERTERRTPHRASRVSIRIGGPDFGLE